MATIVRSFGAVAAAIFVALILVIAVELFSSVVHPVPPGFTGTTEEICLHVERYPDWVLAVVVPAWASTAFAATWIAGRLGNRACAVFIGLLLVVGVTWNILMLPYPAWFKVVTLLSIPAAVACGVYWSSRRNTAAATVVR